MHSLFEMLAVDMVMCALVIFSLAIAKSYVELPVKSAQKLKVFQNAVARLLTMASCREHVPRNGPVAFDVVVTASLATGPFLGTV